MYRINYLFFILIFLLSSGVCIAQEDVKNDDKVGVVKQHYRGLHGYIGYSAARPSDRTDYSYGMGFYSAVWPLIDKPIERFQIGLASAWMTPNNSDNKDKPLAPIGTYARDNWPERGPTWGSVFQTIEGGLGYWARNRFRYGPPKFSMNSTPQCYDYEIGSPGWSFFYDTEALPDDRLGIAQLSNRLLIPPDALPFEGNPNGKFLGCTYMALPFTEPTNGDPPTGDQAWTCFLSTANFKGPIAYFIPETWSKTGKLFDYDFIYGRGLDARPANMGGGAMEINTVPCFESQDQDGITYSKIPQLQFPVDDQGNTLLVQDVTYYSKEALYDSFKGWRDGGELCSGQFNETGAWESALTTRTTKFDQAGKEIIGVEQVFDTKVHDENLWGLEWFDGTRNAFGNFPRYFKHEDDRLVAVSESEVPGETNLLTKEFNLARAGEPFTSPRKGAWTVPGPKAGPFEVNLTDGSIVTYYWYRFVDQPSFQQYSFSESKKEELQALVEKIHNQWPIDRDYMAPPTKGELATFDPALLVTPPKGLEYGYVPIVTNQRKEEPKTNWSFDEKSDSIKGHYRMMEGVKGQAIVMDGYTTRIERPANQVPELDKAFTIEAWIAVGAYPWNWAPIAAQENTISTNSNLDEICWPDDITEKSSKEGFFFGISPQGNLGLHIGNGKWQICRSEDRIPLQEWTHVAASYDEITGVVLYINGKKAASLDVEGFIQARSEELRIGMPRQKIEASNPVRAFATLPSWYSFDGILDEIHLVPELKSDREIANSFSSLKPDFEPDLPPRVMPSGPKGKGKFGASYTHLKYFPEWDAQWRLESDPDIVVQFDDSPVRVVFWRGTRYGPAWVMENGIWMGDQSIENFNGEDGCIEHMLDPRCRFSHVRIIENTPARAVIHWRYLPTSANGNHSQVDPISGWEDWVDEYYTFYPDQVGFRKVVLHSDGVSLWPEEVIGLCQPGQRPEDIIELDAMTLSNLKGEQHTYSWAENSPKFRNKGRWELGGYIHFGEELGEKPNIMMVNMKSEYKPFQIFELECNLTTFAHEHRKEVSHFPWWNHWPAAMIPSDGRYCQAADRPSHFSLAWASPRPHKGENNTYWWTWMYGATKDEIGELTPLAKSWSRPPMLVINSGAADSKFDSTQRCYVVSNNDQKKIDKLEFTIQATEDSPVVNPAFVIKNWGDHQVKLRVNGKKIKQGKNFRIGHVRTINQYDLVIWLELESDSKMEFSIEHKK
ncbi:MAG: LamG domain-containing protein [Bacteroidetes bacterium]|jgi:hypothetical protein|nr:LamG domain-containing protein [Bacteroidota bacterium]MBT4401445.1 LamG domain-containing protein [Bacteroidota bacterium]MBT4411796.1 LamG domain-containing protein [Bacteroidota bacterium]MBT5426582.1 LamG domain-containing protein [Bacteroidota bacterium]MBT7463447.1 LamG domain-containing protein [Bacteroidota bacterium]